MNDGPHVQRSGVRKETITRFGAETGYVPVREVDHSRQNVIDDTGGFATKNTISHKKG